ncbi:response regulator [Larkinella humicola]|uniref:Response regulator n=1 Tax=Larkinella humicola TaxID=2607654 RepID=A0A5N1JSG4_9BACT|nr:response regulator [Larkinella humicola]KAA9357252.1 response regulator [Larkinella humicola]
MTGKQKILVVDDNAAYRQLMTIGLTRAGYDVMIANDGQQALNWLKNPQQRPDLVLVDLLMPRMSGIEVLESIKALPYKLPVILISGAEWPIAREGVAQATPDAFLIKPFAMTELLMKIETLLKPVSEPNA